MSNIWSIYHNSKFTTLLFDQNFYTYLIYPRKASFDLYFFLKYHMTLTWSLYCDEILILYFKQHLVKQVLSLAQLSPSLFQYILKYHRYNILICILHSTLVHILGSPLISWTSPNYLQWKASSTPKRRCKARSPGP